MALLSFSLCSQMYWTIIHFWDSLTPFSIFQCQKYVFSHSNFFSNNLVKSNETWSWFCAHESIWLRKTTRKNMKLIIPSLETLFMCVFHYQFIKSNNLSPHSSRNILYVLVTRTRDAIKFIRTAAAFTHSHHYAKWLWMNGWVNNYSCLVYVGRNNCQPFCCWSTKILIRLLKHLSICVPSRDSCETAIYLLPHFGNFECSNKKETNIFFNWIFHLFCSLYFGYERYRWIHI